MEVNINMDGNLAVIEVTFRSGAAGNYIYKFTNTCSQKSYAGLVVDAIQDQFNDHLADIRRNAYLEGYEHGRNHKRKYTWFGQCFNRKEL